VNDDAVVLWKIFKLKLIFQVPTVGKVKIHVEISIVVDVDVNTGTDVNNKEPYSTEPSPIIVDGNCVCCNYNSVDHIAIPICLGVWMVVINALLSK
jgi:hypothetical protein